MLKELPNRFELDPNIQSHGRISVGRRPIDKTLVAKTRLLERWCFVHSDFFY